MVSYPYFDSVNMISRISEPFRLFPRFPRFPRFRPGPIDTCLTNLPALITIPATLQELNLYNVPPISCIPTREGHGEILAREGHGHGEILAVVCSAALPVSFHG